MHDSSRLVTCVLDNDSAITALCLTLMWMPVMGARNKCCLDSDAGVGVRQMSEIERSGEQRIPTVPPSEESCSMSGFWLKFETVQATLQSQRIVQ